MKISGEWEGLRNSVVNVLLVRILTRGTVRPNQPFFVAERFYSCPYIRAQINRSFYIPSLPMF